MTTLIFLFAILSAPTDRIICDLWTRAITQADMLAACGSLKLEGYRVDVYSLEMVFICSKPATSLPRIAEDCALESPLDHYVLRMVEPGYTTLLCMVASDTEETPTEAEIAEQCPGVTNYVVEFAGSRQSKEAEEFSCPARDLPLGFGLYDQAMDADDLYTDVELTWLAGQLIWNGRVKVTTCEGSSGANTDKIATPCGYLSAHDDVLMWQNQFNTDIYSTAIAWDVPARLLKRMMMIESQFWPYYTGADGETGIMQVTDNGLDTLLRFDRAIDPDYLVRDDENKLWSRAITRQTFECPNCRLEEAIQHIKNTMPYYARLLAAYHCRAVTVNPALTGADAWRQTVVDYNGSANYILKVEQ